MMDLVSLLNRTRLLPAAVIDQPEHAVPIAEALLAGGLNVMEVTFRNVHAADCIRMIRAEVPEMKIGAGTLLTPMQVDEALDAGAQFCVTPGFNPTVVKHTMEKGLFIAPGVCTPGEIEQALELGCSLVKFFPVAVLGGPELIKSVAAPYLHTQLRFIAFGGVNQENLKNYLGLPLVTAVGGSWLVDRSLANNAQWNRISELTRLAVSASKN